MGVLDIVKPGVLSGSEAKKLFDYAKKNKFAIPAVNVVNTDSVNAILVKTKTGELKFAACALIEKTRININKMIRKKLGARKVSFANIEETAKLTEMDIGGVTPLTLSSSLPLWVDSKVMQRKVIVLGGGNRSSKIKVSPKIFNYTPNTEIVDGLAK